MVFNVAPHIRKSRHEWADDHGYNDAWLGLPNQNPYPVNSPEYKAYNNGYFDGDQDVSEFHDAHRDHGYDWYYV